MRHKVHLCTILTECEDTDGDCSWWASHRECTNNPGYMLINCRKSCGVCKDMTGNIYG